MEPSLLIKHDQCGPMWARPGILSAPKAGVVRAICLRRRSGWADVRTAALCSDIVPAAGSRCSPPTEPCQLPLTVATRRCGHNLEDTIRKGTAGGTYLGTTGRACECRLHPLLHALPATLFTRPAREGMCRTITYAFCVLPEAQCRQAALFCLLGGLVTSSILTLRRNLAPQLAAAAQIRMPPQLPHPRPCPRPRMMATHSAGNLQ